MFQTFLLGIHWSIRATILGLTSIGLRLLRNSRV